MPTRPNRRRQGGYIVPTMIVVFVLVELGSKLGLPKESQEKAKIVYGSALEGLDHMRSAGVKAGFGTDLLGETYVQQCRELTIRREVFSPVEILRQTSSIAAEILMQDGKLGCIAPGTHVDLLVVDGDPLADIGLLAACGEKLDLIMRGGGIVKNRL